MKKTSIICGILCGILTLFGIVVAFISLAAGSKEIFIAADCLNILLCTLIAWYAFIGYLKPHGNLLRFVILFAAVSGLSCVIPYIERENTVGLFLLSIQIGLTCYMAGRLVRRNENIVLMILIAACRIAMCVIDFSAGNVNISLLTPLAIWFDICVAYLLRYKEHREAGLQDEPKK